MQSYNTPERHGYSVRFSPFEPNHVLLAASQLYGLAGGGTLFLLEQSSKHAGGISEICRVEWSDGLFDAAWCPYADNVAATASGDGSLQIWGGLDVDADVTLKAHSKPIVCLQEHKNEVYSIDWGEQWNYHQLLSASWDGSIKLWDCNRQNSVATYVGHTDLIYCKPLMSIEAAHSSEVLACDWSHFDRNMLVTGGSNGLVRAWDLRNMRHYVFQLFSGEFAVRRLAFSPTTASVLAAANYDFTTRIWDYNQSLDAMEINVNHTEFVCGLEWNTNRPHQLADCGWDAVVNIYTPKTLKHVLN